MEDGGEPRPGGEPAQGPQGSLNLFRPETRLRFYENRIEQALRVRDLLNREDEDDEDLAAAANESSDDSDTDISADEGEDRQDGVWTNEGDVPPNCGMTYKEITTFSNYKYNVTMRNLNMRPIDRETCDDIREDYKARLKIRDRILRRRRRRARRILDAKRVKFDLMIALRQELGNLDRGILLNTDLLRDYQRLRRAEEERNQGVARE